MNTFLNILAGFLLRSSRRDSNSKELSKEELIEAFRTITTIINILQSLVHSVDDSPAPKDPSTAKLSRSDARALRILTALAIAIVRKKEVTAVVAGHPQRPRDGRVQVIATRQPNSPPHQFFALRNPHTAHPKVADAVQYELLMPPPNLKIDLLDPLTNLDPS